MTKTLCLTVLSCVICAVWSQDNISTKNTSIWLSMENLPETLKTVIYYDEYFGKDFATKSYLSSDKTLNILISCLRPGTKYKIILESRDTPAKLLRKFELTTTGESAVGKTWNICKVNNLIKFQVKNDTIQNFSDKELKETMKLSGTQHTCGDQNHTFCTFSSKSFDIWLTAKEKIYYSILVVIIGSKPEKPVTTPHILTRLVDKENKSFWFEWRRDEDSYRYIVRYTVNGVSKEAKLADNFTSYTISNMKTGLSYEITLCAENKNSYSCTKNPMVVIIAISEGRPAQEPDDGLEVTTVGIGLGVLGAAILVTILLYILVSKTCGKKHSRLSDSNKLALIRTTNGIGVVDQPEYFDQESNRTNIPNSRNPYVRGSQLREFRDETPPQPPPPNRDSVYSMAVSEHEENHARH